MQIVAKHRNESERRRYVAELTVYKADMFIWINLHCSATYAPYSIGTRDGIPELREDMILAVFSSITADDCQRWMAHC